eukprot:GAHX01006761.1.p3 GENE.GAHX01006761.1~~GAHX01006761.1.p3  ORF type:complete len:51 (+),score=3.43 GAHX01006761.1:22-153(+)
MLFKVNLESIENIIMRHHIIHMCITPLVLHKNTDKSFYIIHGN